MTAQIGPGHAQRGRLFALAYRMLGSVGEAEDIVQEAYLRWYAEPRDEVRNPAAFLTTVVSHLCLDQLRSRRRSAYPGVWLPEPLPQDLEDELLQGDADAHLDPQEALLRAESVSLAFLAVLEALSPFERAVYLLTEVFDHSHAEVGRLLQRSEDACRQALRRARRHLASRKRGMASLEQHQRLLLSFLAACQQGRVEDLMQLLADDVRYCSDGGGVGPAANRPVQGPRAVARLQVGLWRMAPPGLEARIMRVNGWPALVVMQGSRVQALLQVRVDGHRIDRVDVVTHPAKLARLGVSLGVSPEHARAPGACDGAWEPSSPGDAS